MPFLTLAIPTYNRLRWLSFTLPVILAQAKEFPQGDIEVVVSDNCSTDGTWPYLEELANHFSFLRLNRNETNIGSEANFYLLPKLATGRYLWMIGDDDSLNAGAVRRVMEALKEEPDYLIVNHDVYDAGLERCLKRDNLGTVSDEDFSTLDACLNRIDAMAMSYISMWVGRREFFNRITEEKYRYFAQWGMSIQADRYFGVNRFPTGKLISTPSLRARQNTDFNEEAYFCCFLHGSAEVFRYTEEAGVLSSDACRARRSLLLRRHALKRIRFERRTGIFARRKTYEMLRSDYGDLGVFWLLCVPMMYMPGVGSLLKLARRLLGRSEA